jgi:hypothetical protein
MLAVKKSNVFVVSEYYLRHHLCENEGNVWKYAEDKGEIFWRIRREGVEPCNLFPWPQYSSE